MTTDKETRRKVLLAAALAHVLRCRGGEDSASAVSWGRAAGADLRRSAWNPRRGSAAWRFDGRLRQHDATPTGN